MQFQQKYERLLTYQVGKCTLAIKLAENMSMSQMKPAAKRGREREREIKSSWRQEGAWGSFCDNKWIIAHADFSILRTHQEEPQRKNPRRNLRPHGIAPS